MKKSMIAFGVAALCGAVSFADVTSANTVGYIGNTLADGNFNMIAASFNKVDGTGLQPNDGDLKFENLIEGTTFGSDVDTIEVWDPNRGYTYHFYYEGDGWTDDSGNGYFEDDYPNGLAAGDAMWLEAAAGHDGDLKVTIAGAVEDADDVPYELVAGNFNMISNPYPINWDPNDSTKVAFENIIEGTTFGSDVDTIEVWDPNRGYTYHFYYEGDGWTDDSGNGYFEDDYPNGLAAGQPVWFEAAPNANVPTVTFLNPLKK